MIRKKRQGSQTLTKYSSKYDSAQTGKQANYRCDKLRRDLYRQIYTGWIKSVWDKRQLVFVRLRLLPSTKSPFDIANWTFSGDIVIVYQKLLCCLVKSGKLWTLKKLTWIPLSNWFWCLLRWLWVCSWSNTNNIIKAQVVPLLTIAPVHYSGRGVQRGKLCQMQRICHYEAVMYWYMSGTCNKSILGSDWNKLVCVAQQTEPVTTGGQWSHLAVSAQM